MPPVPPTTGEPVILAQHLDVDALSAYLDQQLPPAEQAAAARHLATCPDCARELAELRATVTLLRTLPQYEAGRDFQLGPEYARRRRWPGSLADRIAWGWLDRLVPALPTLRLATMAVAVLLVVAIAGDVVTGRQPMVPAGETTGLVRQAPPPPAADTAPEAVDGVPPAAMNEAPAMAPTVTEPQAAFQPLPPAAPAGEAAPGGAAENEVAEAPAPRPAPGSGTEAAVPASMKAAADAGDASRQAAAPASGWRLAAVALGLILVWLIILLAATTARRRRGFW